MDVRESTSRIAAAAIIARIERLPRNSLAVRARLLIGAATFMDGFDVIVIASTLPVLIQKWSLSHSDVGILISLSAVGQLFGALLLPMLAERFGRVSIVAWSAGIIGMMSLACCFSTAFVPFVLFRVLQGVGLGAEIPVSVTYINEITRAHGRGRFVLLYEMVFPVGLLAANALGAWIVPKFGWQFMYLIGASPLVLFLFIKRLVPESPRWLAERGRFDEADIAVMRFEATAKGPLLPIDLTASNEPYLPVRPQRRITDLFGRAYILRTVVVALIWTTSGAIQFGLATWLPTILQSVYHASLQMALNMGAITSVLMLFGAGICALLVDIVGRKPLIVVSYSACAVLLVATGLFHAESAYIIATLCALSFAFMASGVMTAYVYTPELYPTSIRAMGCGLGFAWVKVAAIWSSGATAKLLDLGHIDYLFYAFSVAPLLAAVIVQVFGAETNGKILEILEA